MVNKNIYFSYDGGENFSKVADYLQYDIYGRMPNFVLDPNETSQDILIVKRNGVFPEDIVRYLLSKDRVFLPDEVSCGDKKDYSEIERIVSEEFGGHLKNSFFGKIFNCREIEKGKISSY
jgi:hypothetical protein